MTLFPQIYALFFQFLSRQTFQKICNIHVQNEGGGGVKGRLNNVQKNCTFLTRWHPLWLKKISNFCAIYCNPLLFSHLSRLNLIILMILLFTWESEVKFPGNFQNLNLLPAGSRYSSSQQSPSFEQPSPLLGYLPDWLPCFPEQNR